MGKTLCGGDGQRRSSDAGVEELGCGGAMARAGVRTRDNVCLSIDIERDQIFIERIVDAE